MRDLRANSLPTNGPEGINSQRKGRQAGLSRLCTQPSLWLPLCPLFLLQQPSPTTTDLPWQRGLAPAAYQRTHFVPTPLRPLLHFTVFRVLFIYIAQEPLCPDHWCDQLLPVSTHIHKHMKAEMQLSFFCPSLLTTSTVFMVWGYVKEQHPFDLQPSFLPHRKHLSSHDPRVNLTALQSSGLPEHTSNFILSICSSKG